MTRKTKHVLLEAIRRYHSFHPNESPLAAWVGLGAPSTYKEIVEQGYMVPVSPVQPRISGWYKLTEKGLAACLKLQNEGFVVRDYKVYPIPSQERN